MKEVFKDITGYEGLYQISNLSNVKSKERIVIRENGVRLSIKETILTPAVGNHGYKVVVLNKNGIRKQVLIHRLVAEAFIPNPNNYREVNHKDGNKLNNDVSNLEFCTYSENLKHAYKNNLRKTKKYICVETGKEYSSTIEIEKLTGISRQHITQCCKGTRKTTGGYHWKYKD